MEPSLYNEKFKVESLNGSSAKIRCQSRLSEKIASNPITEHEIAEHMWGKVKTMIIASADEDHENNTQKEQLLEEDDIALEEVHEALAKLKDRKAPNPDQVVKEMFKYGGSELEIVITNHIVSKIISTQKEPTD
ncbi:hypothetical protein Trydic_g2151 [Trypoxylus dichotomus]